jgi:hypothetical protein
MKPPRRVATLVAPKVRFTGARFVVPTGIPYARGRIRRAEGEQLRSASIVSPRWAANDRAVRIESEKPTRKMPPATPISHQVARQPAEL